jgi:uncharacterized membrane protein
MFVQVYYICRWPNVGLCPLGYHHFWMMHWLFSILQLVLISHRLLLLFLPTTIHNTLKITFFSIVHWHWCDCPHHCCAVGFILIYRIRTKLILVDYLYLYLLYSYQCEYSLNDVMDWRDKVNMSLLMWYLDPYHISHQFQSQVATLPVCDSYGLCSHKYALFFISIPFPPLDQGSC